MKVTFNENRPVYGSSISDPSQDLIQNTLNLRQVSLENALRYGGPITARALGAMRFRGDRKHIVVDTKVSYLMPGLIPAIPGWHTDGVPRGIDLDPGGKAEPSMTAQLSGQITTPRYHLLVTGDHCPTKFIRETLVLDVEDGVDLYSKMDRDVEQMADLDCVETPASMVMEWDWFNIHKAQQAKAAGWRYLIRVTETDYIAPREDPAEFIRTQNQVYVPANFGW